MRVDSHQHFWRIARGDYGWLTPDAFPTLCRDFLPSDLAPLVARAGFDRTVLVQAAPSLGETAFLLALAEVTPFVGAVVGWVDMVSRAAPSQVERLAEHGFLKALRPMLQDLADPDWILRAEAAPALRAMQGAGLRFDALVRPPQLPAIRRLLDRFPDLPVVIDHGGKPSIQAGAFQPWAEHMGAIARDSGAVCKLSGLLTEAGPGWTADTLRPYVDHLLESFGPSRLMFGSDWPVLTVDGDFDGWLAVAESLTAELTPQERSDLFGGVAARFYGIE